MIQIDKTRKNHLGIIYVILFCSLLLPLSAVADAGVSGAGTAATNGTYVEGATFNGKPSYSNGTYFMFWNSALNEWNIGEALNNATNILYFHTSDTPLPSATGWQQDIGALPIPTITPVLPVEWAYFQAQTKDRQVKIEWGTFTETNLSYYDLERKDQSTDQWQNIYHHPVEKAHTYSLQNYTFTDGLAPAGYVQYRVKQVDINGDFSYSKYIELSIKAESLTLFPNPTQNQLHIRDLLINQDLIGIEILDLRGNRVQFFSREEIPQLLQVSTLKSGHYCLQVLRRDPKKNERRIFQKW